MHLRQHIQTICQCNCLLLFLFNAFSISLQEVNENSLKRLNGYLESLQKPGARSVQSTRLTFYVRETKEKNDLENDIIPSGNCLFTACFNDLLTFLEYDVIFPVHFFGGIIIHLYTTFPRVPFCELHSAHQGCPEHCDGRSQVLQPVRRAHEGAGSQHRDSQELTKSWNSFLQTNQMGQNLLHLYWLQRPRAGVGAGQESRAHTQVYESTYRYELKFSHRCVKGA